jgi:signal transduction histidine kinase
MAVAAPPEQSRIRGGLGLMRSVQQRTDPTTAVQAVRRGMISAAVLWQLLWILAQPGLWPGAQSGPFATAAMWAVLGFAAVLLLSHALAREWVSARVARADAVVLLVATLVVNASQLRGGVPDWHRVAELAALTCGIAGLVLPFRWAVVSTAAMTGLLLRDVLLPDWSGVFHASVDSLVEPVYVMAVGLSAAVAARVLVAQAGAADGAADALLRAERERRSAERVEQEMRATERRLHETVLNTLVALARGGLAPSMSDRLRERSLEGARLLSSLRGRGPAIESRSSVVETDRVEPYDLLHDLQPSLDDLREVGIEVSISVDGPIRAPRYVQDALRTAATEALINVGRHAEASRVSLRVASGGGSEPVAVEVRVRDDGRGLPDVLPETRFGLTDIITAPMVDVGGTAEVVSRSGKGTEVILGWRPGFEACEAREDSLDPAPAALAVPVLAALAVYAAVMVAGSWDSAERPVVNGLAFGILIALGLLVGLASRRGRLALWVVFVVALGGWAVYVLAESPLPESASIAWASPAIAGLFLVAAAIGPPWGWLLLLAAWLIFQGDPLHEITQPGTAMILVGALLGRSLRRNARVAWRHRQEEADAATAGQVVRERIEGIGARYHALALSEAPELLRDVAEGRCDPEDDRVRARAAREERFIRNVMRTDPSTDAVHEMACELICLAHQQGVLLDLDLSAPRQPEVSVEGSIVGSLTRVMRQALPTVIVAGLPVGSPARLSTRQEGESVMLRLLVPMAVDARPGSGADGSVVGSLVDPADAAGQLWLWEASLRGEELP